MTEPADPSPIDETLDELPLESAGEEDESDLRGDDQSAIEEAIVAGTDWTTETILTQLERENIELNPRFQRRDAWARGNRKSRFIESLFLGLPVPQIVLAEKRGERGSFIVIDGKQRLLTLRQFAAASGGDFSPMVLKGLEVRKDLNGHSLQQLRASSRFARDVRAFDNQTMRTVIVRHWPDEMFLYRVFLRLNSGTVPLSPQELRQALHPGPFTFFADDLALGSQQVKRALRLSEPDFRMRDVEIVVRYFAFDQFLADYRGDLKQFLDDTCKRLNDMWGTQEEAIRRSAAQLDSAIETTFDVFEGAAFRRWNGTAFERYFNRAVFDLMTYFFKYDAVAARARHRKARVLDAFKELSVSDTAFQQSLTATTKSRSATNVRLDRWGGALGTILSMNLSASQLRAFRAEF